MNKLIVRFFATSLLVWIAGLLFAQNAVEQKMSTLSQINSKIDEENPVFHPDGKTLYFNRSNDSLNVGGVRDKGDIWFSVFENGAWSKPENLGAPINNNHYNRMLGFSPDGKVMFLHQHYLKDGRKANTQGLSYSVREGNTWSFPEPLPVEYFYNKSEHQSGSISKDGRIMVLALDAYNSRGNEDIYVCFYENGKWTTPRNLGSTINTDGEELTPYLAPDNKTLYFSSNGHGGAGGKDVFKSVRQDDTWRIWSTPENLGQEVNSEGVEIAFTLDDSGVFAYYATTRNSDGYGDITAWKLPPESKIEEEEALEMVNYAAMIEVEVEIDTEDEATEETKNKAIALKGTVINAKDNTPVEGAKVKFFAAQFSDSTTTSAVKPQYNIEVPVDIRKVSIEVKAAGFMTQEESLVIEAEGASDIQKDFFLTPLEVGTTIQLSKVYFERGAASLLEESSEELDRLVELLNENPNMEIEIAGHTDNQGNARLNLQLSRDRVAIVEKYLLDKGIAKKRVKGKGYGGSRPIASNASEETRKLNRRVEFSIIKN
ncbi:MAG: OmpA family protein [Cyclobacteriaceae bacterium]